MTPVELRDALQVVVLVGLVGKAVLDWLYGPSRIAHLEESIQKLHKKASDRADELQKWCGRIDVQFAEDRGDHRRFDEQLQQLWHIIERRKP